MSAELPGQSRVLALDWIKAAAIFAVIVTHSGFDFFRDDVTRWDVVLRQSWTSFHVPAFLFVSGYLYCRTGPVDLAHVGSRLGRVLLPYLVASVFVQVVGYANVQDLPDALFQLATGSAVGIYYYVAVLVLCTPLIWPLSRMAPRSVVALLGAFALYSVAAGFFTGLHTTQQWFWSVRNPLELFYLGYFLAGWCAALYAARIHAWFRAAPGAWISLASLGLAVGIGLSQWSGIQTLSLDVRVLIFVVYTFSVVGMIAALVGGRTPPAAVRFLSGGTLTIYLYHRLAQQALLPYTETWSPIVRIVVLILVGLGAGSAVCWLGRRLLGDRWGEAATRRLSPETKSGGRSQGSARPFPTPWKKVFSRR